jgi:hypothetical protein
MTTTMVEQNLNFCTQFEIVLIKEETKKKKKKMVQGATHFVASFF